MSQYRQEFVLALQQLPGPAFYSLIELYYTANWESWCPPGSDDEIEHDNEGDGMEQDKPDIDRESYYHFNHSTAECKLIPVAWPVIQAIVRRAIQEKVKKLVEGNHEEELLDSLRTWKMKIVDKWIQRSVMISPSGKMMDRNGEFYRCDRRCIHETRNAGFVQNHGQFVL